jgi:hypothetical protein
MPAADMIAYATGTEYGYNVVASDHILESCRV